MTKILGGVSCSGRNVAAGKSELPASTEIAEHVYITNNNTERIHHT